MKNLTWQNPEQLFVAQELINKVKSKCCGIKGVYYHKAVKKDGVWYVRNQNGSEPYYGMDVVAGTNSVSYTANENVKYFFEVEDLPVVQGGSFDGWRNDGLANRSSNGVAPRHYAKNYAYTEALAGGVYTLSMNARNQSGSGSDNITIAIMDEGGNITPLETQFDDWAKASTDEKTVSVSIPDGAKFVLKAGENNSNLNMDFLMFTRTGDYNVHATTTAAGKGWATLYTDKALDFTNATPATLKAYTATLEGTTVTLTEVQNVPAGTGVVLKSSTTGENTEYSIPVIANSSTEKGHMTGSTSNTNLAEGAAYILGINNTTGKAQFFINSAGTIAAGKAYLPVGTNPAKALSVVFANDLTGITNANAAEKIAQPAKRIVNGQLVIEKNGKRYNAAGAEL